MVCSGLLRPEVQNCLQIGPLTPRVPPQDELADLIIDEDEETVGKGTEPPGDPEKQ